MKYSLNRQFEKNKELKSDNFVLVYQMGKVGSSSIEHTLSDYNIPSYHIHTFDDHESFKCITIVRTSKSSLILKIGRCTALS